LTAWCADAQIEAEGKIEALSEVVKKAEAAHIHAVAEAAVLEKPAPASGVAEAMARLVFAKDNVNTLRQARQTIEAELPDWEQAAIDADVEVERLISAIIADYVQVLILEAQELARRLAQYRAALMAFTRDYQDRPTQWHKQSAFERVRQPLDEAANQAFAFFKNLREATAPSPCWKSARERLRENPEAAVLQHLVSEFDGLCALADDQNRGEPAAPT
jgi:hypothetical protein